MAGLSKISRIMFEIMKKEQQGFVIDCIVMKSKFSNELEKELFNDGMNFTDFKDSIIDTFYGFKLYINDKDIDNDFEVFVK